MSQTFAPITDAELVAAGFTHRTGSTANRVIEGVERDPERVVVYSVRKPYGADVQGRAAHGPIRRYGLVAGRHGVAR